MYHVLFRVYELIFRIDFSMVFYLYFQLCIVFYVLGLQEMSINLTENVLAVPVFLHIF